MVERGQVGRADLHFHANHALAAIGKVDASAQQGVRADVAEAGKADEAILVNVGRHQPDFVHVGSQHDALAIFTFRPFAHDQVAERVHADFVGIRFHLGADDFPDGGFVAGRGEGFGQFLDERFHRFFTTGRE